MLADLLKSSLVTMNLRIIDHASLLAGQTDVCAQVLKRDKETCHVCGVSVPGFMEIDHLNGHRKCGPKDLRCICQFCHNLKHPLWAGSRKRFVPVFAPDLTQEDIHRLAWVVVAWREKTEDAQVDVSGVISDMRLRHHRLTETIGCTSAESLFEAILGLTDVMDAKMAQSAAMRLDQFVRFWPAETTENADKSDAGTRLSTWDVGGFFPIAEDAATKIRETYRPNFDVLRNAANALKAE